MIHWYTSILCYTYVSSILNTIPPPPLTAVRTTKLIKIKKEYALIIPESIAKLYAFKDGQVFNLEVKESNNIEKLVFLTYAIATK